MQECLSERKRVSLLGRLDYSKWNHIEVRVYVQLYLRGVRLCLSVHVSVCMCVPVGVCMWVCICLHMYVCVCVCLCVCGVCVGERQ